MFLWHLAFWDLQDSSRASRNYSPERDAGGRGGCKRGSVKVPQGLLFHLHIAFREVTGWRSPGHSGLHGSSLRLNLGPSKLKLPKPPNTIPPHWVSSASSLHNQTAPLAGSWQHGASHLAPPTASLSPAVHPVLLPLICSQMPISSDQRISPLLGACDLCLVNCSAHCGSPSQSSLLLSLLRVFSLCYYLLI